MKFLFFIFFLMSYVNMQAKVTIGDVYFPSINEFVIKESIEETSDEAVITLARNYKELKNKKVLDYIKAGYPVTIESGYDDNIATEFTGYVKYAPDVDFPLVITCDELFPLRQNNHVLSYKDISLRDLLTTIAPGYTIECPDMRMGKIHIPNWSSYKVLAEIKKTWGFYSRISGKVLHVGFAYDWQPASTNIHTYTIGENVRDHSKLKFSTETDFNVQVNVRVHLPNGKIVIVKKDTGHTGTDVKVKELNCYNKPIKEVENMAKAQLRKLLYNGYTGSIDGFALPRTHAGDSLTIINPVYPEREGTYLIEKATITFKESEYIRENFLTYKIR
jgi:hypothetical protein